MKGLYVTVLVTIAVVLAVSANTAFAQGPQSECPQFCTFEYVPVCAEDGDCYRVYPNDCSLRSERCTKKSALRSVDMKNCDLAQDTSNSDPSKKMCAN